MKFVLNTRTMTNATLGQFFTTFAYIVGAIVLWCDLRRRNMATEGLGLIAVWALCGGVLGAKVTEWILVHPLYFAGQPLQFLDPRQGGRTVIGGILFGWLFVEIAKRKLGVRRSTGDSFALALPLGEAVGRIGCLFNGCCYGVVCESSTRWAMWQHGAWRFPTQMMLSLASLLIFLVVLWVRPRLPREGDAWILYLALFGGSRFVIEFWRERTALIGVWSLAQIVCLLLATMSTRWLWAHWREKSTISPEKIEWKAV
ncbi:MAG TPA: prolipoprotein diacylglyceryl transferase family protein [Abditibacteriaceae bacterium]|nr:prolipoprotein diacylglyceryl transferase family protein [Abditibacteriaceae bacterium]